MTDAARALIRQAMQKAQDPTQASAYAPSNIALSKYWGKRDKSRNLPLNSSVSISLGDLGSHTQVGPSATGSDEVVLNGESLDLDTGFARKAVNFVNMFRADRQMPLRIDTRNTVPTASGLASSASGFAALTVAISQSFGLDLRPSQLSMIARLGSGSACRSLWHGFVRWNRGTVVDGSDSFGEPLETAWPDFRIAILETDTRPKPHSSRDGMNHTVATSPLFSGWPDQAERDCETVTRAILEHDFDTLGPTAEANALAMHATMQAARPSLCYLTSDSWALLERLWAARQEGLNAYATMDAGPNVKLLCLKPDVSDLLQAFPEAQVINPYAHATSA